MAHFAKLGIGNIVETVEVVNNNILLDENGVEQEQLGIDFLRNLYNEPNAQWKQTSYNNNFRTRYAFIGGIYSQEHDAFLYPKNYPSWILDEDLKWKAPVDYPTDGQKYNWNETNQTWDLVE